MMWRMRQTARSLPARSLAGVLVVFALAGCVASDVSAGVASPLEADPYVVAARAADGGPAVWEPMAVAENDSADGAAINACVIDADVTAPGGAEYIAAAGTVATLTVVTDPGTGELVIRDVAATADTCDATGALAAATR